MEGASSSADRTSDVELEVRNVAVALGASETIHFGDIAGGANIFHNYIEGSAGDLIFGEEYELTCATGGVATGALEVAASTAHEVIALSHRATGTFWYEGFGTCSCLPPVIAASVLTCGKGGSVGKVRPTVHTLWLNLNRISRCDQHGLNRSRTY